MKKITLIFILNIPVFLGWAQMYEKLPEFDKQQATVEKDWLIEKVDDKADLYRTADGKLVLSNGIISRTFSIEPNGATVGLEHLGTNESYLRSVRPEAQVVIDGFPFDVGGLTGQPIHNYLLPGWLEEMESDPLAFQLVSFETGDMKQRFDWKKRMEWMPRDLPWPPEGKMLTFHYQLRKEAIRLLAEQSLSDASRPVLFKDEFQTLNSKWKIFTSAAHERNSFINEGKAGEIMALANTAVFAEQPVPGNTRVILARIDPGTDRSSGWGPGMALVFDKRMVKVNLHTGRDRFGVFDGETGDFMDGLKSGQPVYLRMKMLQEGIEASYSYDGKEWMYLAEIPNPEGVMPRSVRVGKMDPSGGSDDSRNPGEQGRSHILEFSMLGPVPGQVKQNSVEALSYLENIRINVHYEMYDGLPLLCKWFTLENRSVRQIRVDGFKSEILAVTEPESAVGVKQNWMYPNISVETDYTFGGGMSSTSSLGKSVYWETDPLYRTQVNYERVMPVLLECRPQYGPAQKVNPGDTFESFRTWELLHDSWDRERKGLEKRRMYRTIAPWVTENPILMHVRRADNASVKKAIDQCEEVGFELVIMTFGSGFNLEDTTRANLARMKELADYAHSKGIALGGYSLLASRRVGGGNDVEMPEGMRPTFGNSPCLQSEWGIGYFDKLYNFYRETGQDILEHDGSYPGDPCLATHHPGHDGFDDSQWSQFRKIQSFYHWCRANGIYLNVPDWYFLNGSSKTGMGYRETNWSLPRHQQEIIERQNIYDGTWEKTPSMGWMFVPLVQYHGGGAAATIEPLKEHLPHFGQRLANLFGAGVQACYRGPQLYDAPETKALVEKWVDFYKSHRRILDGDIIHIRRPDGQDYDAILHVDPSGETKGLLMVYNPLTEDIHRTLRVNLYYTGLKDAARISEQGRKFKEYRLDRDYSIGLEVHIPAKSQTWFVIED